MTAQEEKVELEGRGGRMGEGGYLTYVIITMANSHSLALIHCLTSYFISVFLSKGTHREFSNAADGI